MVMIMITGSGLDGGMGWDGVDRVSEIDGWIGGWMDGLDEWMDGLDANSGFQRID